MGFGVGFVRQRGACLGSVVRVRLRVRVRVRLRVRVRVRVRVGCVVLTVFCEEPG